ncbi:MAG: hypothetical protein M3O34_07310 [Chloroflexota bacterium]|nr:hypothetical protein [Chloroflexota bacterium]
MSLALALAALGWDLSEDWRTAPAAVAGQIVVPFQGGISVVDPATGRTREVVQAGQSETITSVAWSPDYGRVAYGLFHRAAGDQVSSGEIFVAPAGGGTAELAVPRDRPGSVADLPRWSPDGQYLYFSYQGLEGRQPVARVERVRLADGTRTPLFDDAVTPDVSPDGQAVAFVHDDVNGQSLMVGPADGGQARELVSRDVFTALAGPRFSPDGTRIAFVAVGAGPGAADAGPMDRLASFFAVPVAYAHGEPWSVWTVRTDGTDRRRASSLQEDEPLVAWSPDGAWLAVYGTGGLWVVAVDGSTEPRRIAHGSFGAIDW